MRSTPSGERTAPTEGGTMRGGAGAAARGDERAPCAGRFTDEGTRARTVGSGTPPERRGLPLLAVLDPQLLEPREVDLVDPLHRRLDRLHVVATDLPDRVEELEEALLRRLALAQELDQHGGLLVLVPGVVRAGHGLAAGGVEQARRLHQLGERHVAVAADLTRGGVEVVLRALDVLRDALLQP